MPKMIVNDADTHWLNIVVLVEASRQILGTEIADLMFRSLS